MPGHQVRHRRTRRVTSSGPLTDGAPARCSTGRSGRARAAATSAAAPRTSATRHVALVRARARPAARRPPPRGRRGRPRRASGPRAVDAGAGRPAGPAGPGAGIAAASAPRVGCSNTARSATVGTEGLGSRLASRVASRLWPPRSKKSSSTCGVSTCKQLAPDARPRSARRRCAAACPRLRGRPAPAAPRGRSCCWRCAASRPARTSADGTMYRRQHGSAALRATARVVVVADDVADDSRVAGAGPHGAPRPLRDTPGWASMTDSISPSSMRWPRSLTWLSVRPGSAAGRRRSRPRGRRCGTSARPGCHGSGTEPLRGQVGTVMVAARHAAAAEPQLALSRRAAAAALAGRARRRRCSSSGRPIVDRAGVDRPRTGRPDRRLGRAVAVPQLRHPARAESVARARRSTPRRRTAPRRSGAARPASRRAASARSTAWPAHVVTP